MELTYICYNTLHTDIYVEKGKENTIMMVFKD